MPEMTKDERLALLENKCRAYRRMARNMAALIPADQLPMHDFTRADGNVPCKECGLPYSEHPEARNVPTFHVTCAGRIVKT